MNMGLAEALDEIDRLRERLSVAGHAVDESRELALNVADEIQAERDEAVRECQRLRALLVEACDMGSLIASPTSDVYDILSALARLSQIRALAETEGE
jgi:hypothetical protein